VSVAFYTLVVLLTGLGSDVERIERLEDEVRRLNERLQYPSELQSHDASPAEHYSAASAGSYATYSDPSAPLEVLRNVNTASSSAPSQASGLVGYAIRRCNGSDLVSAGIVAEADALSYFSTFMEGCIWFVPIFDPNKDTYSVVRSKSSILFDVIIIFGARAANGVLSRTFQSLYPLLREHTSDLVLRLSANAGPPDIADIQALLVIASYSDSGAVLCDVAVRSCLNARLPDQVNEHFATSLTGRSASLSADDSIYVTRIWYYLFVLDVSAAMTKS
jgi:hypothetical protein